ncbi:ATP-binding protein [Candidatus Woesearchaeota archaeon]|nr:ATP-binding protein [Candidatus Woesearchaeota archaeon]
MKRYVLTGGPSSGKSCVAVGLELKGEYVIPECAEAVIRYLQAKGIKEPWNGYGDFQKDIFQLQSWRCQLANPNVKRVFMDRHFQDQEYYCDILRQERPDLETATELYPISKVFIFEPLKFYDKTHIRREDESEALRLYHVHKEHYENLGLNVISVPPLELEKRIDYVMERLS